MRTARPRIYGTCLEAGSDHNHRGTLPAPPGGIVSRGASLSPDPSLHGLHIPALFHPAYERAADCLVGPAGRTCEWTRDCLLEPPGLVGRGGLYPGRRPFSSVL